MTAPALLACSVGRVLHLHWVQVDLAGLIHRLVETLIDPPSWEHCLAKCPGWKLLHAVVYHLALEVATVLLAMLHIAFCAPDPCRRNLSAFLKATKDGQMLREEHCRHPNVHEVVRISTTRMA